MNINLGSVLLISARITVTTMGGSRATAARLSASARVMDSGELQVAVSAQEGTKLHEMVINVSKKCQIDLLTGTHQQTGLWRSRV